MRSAFADPHTKLGTCGEIRATTKSQAEQAPPEHKAKPSPNSDSGDSYLTSALRSGWPSLDVTRQNRPRSSDGQEVPGLTVDIQNEGHKLRIEGHSLPGVFGTIALSLLCSDLRTRGRLGGFG